MIEIKNRNSQALVVKENDQEITLEYREQSLFHFKRMRFLGNDTVKIIVESQEGCLDVDSLPHYYKTKLFNKKITNILDLQRISLVKNINHLKAKKSFLEKANLVLNHYTEFAQLVRNSVFQNKLEKALGLCWSLTGNELMQLVDNYEFYCRSCLVKQKGPAFFSALGQCTDPVIPVLHYNCFVTAVTQKLGNARLLDRIRNIDVPYDVYLPMVSDSNYALFVDHCIEQENAAAQADNAFFCGSNYYDHFFADWSAGVLLIPRDSFLKSRKAIDDLSDLSCNASDSMLCANQKTSDLFIHVVSLGHFKRELLNQPKHPTQNDYSLQLFFSIQLSQLLVQYIIEGSMLFVGDEIRAKFHQLICKWIYETFGYSLYKVFMLKYTLDGLRTVLNFNLKSSVVFYNDLCDQHMEEIKNLILVRDSFLNKHDEFIKRNFSYFSGCQKDNCIGFKFLIYNTSGDKKRNDAAYQLHNFSDISGKMLDEITALLNRIDKIPLPY